MEYVLDTLDWLALLVAEAPDQVELSEPFSLGSEPGELVMIYCVAHIFA